MKISIIIPVYNVESYVEECIKSVCNQTLKDIEIIVINDGSKDDSINKIKRIKDKRIKIITQENKGLSCARNKGLKCAIGDYIAFVDSDDFIGITTAYEEMYRIALTHQSDIVTGNAAWYYSISNKYLRERDERLFPSSPMTGEEFLLTSIKNNIIYVPIWLNIYNRDFLLKNDLFFKEGRYHEDEYFTHELLIKAKKVSIYNKHFYMYRQGRSKSIMSILSKKRCLDMLDSCLANEKQLINIKNCELKELLKNRIAMMAILTIYDHKFKDVSNEIKKMINRNAITKNVKIRSKILNLSSSLYIKVEWIYRKLKNILKNLWR